MNFDTRSNLEVLYVVIYNNIWTPFQNEQLFTKPDDREEALEYDKYSIGIFRLKNTEENELVGHVPVELSSLLYHFLNAESNNEIKLA